jgi:hypothetical protein
MTSELEWILPVLPLWEDIFSSRLMYLLHRVVHISRQACDVLIYPRSLPGLQVVLNIVSGAQAESTW